MLPKNGSMNHESSSADEPAHATRCMAPAALHFASRTPIRVVFRVALRRENTGVPNSCRVRFECSRGDKTPIELFACGTQDWPVSVLASVCARFAGMCGWHRMDSKLRTNGMGNMSATDGFRVLFSLDPPC
jgi:hypothetical protein